MSEPVANDQKPNEHVDENKPQPGNPADDTILSRSRSRTRRSFLIAAAGAAAGYGLYRHLDVGPEEDMLSTVLRRTLNVNADLSHGLFGNHILSPTYPLSRAETLRINAVYGLGMDLVPESYRLQLVGMANQEQHPAYVKDVTAWEYKYKAPPADEDKGHDTKIDPAKAGKPPAGPGNAPPAGTPPPPAPGKPMPMGRDEATSSSMKMAPMPQLAQTQEDENHTGRKPRGMGEAGESDSTLPPNTPGLLLQMSDITRLPRQEFVTQFKCIEGWSQIVRWAGVRMADFLEAYPPANIDGREPKYVYMETPDGDYYTGYELKQLRHPQALLVTEMMGAPLTQNHGAPLRLHMPTKYGYKQIKRIGLIAYTNDKPDDYWTKLGYDWHADL